MSLKLEEVSSDEKKEKGNENNNKKELVSSEAVRQLQEELNQLKDIVSNTKSSASSSDMKELVKELRNDSSDKAFGEGSYINESEIDLEDHIEKGVTFFTHNVGYVIVDDIRSGHPVSTPFNTKIIFKYQSTKKEGSGKEVMLRNLSVYTSYSQKEVDWLKEHRFYGSIFFNSHTQTLSLDAKKAHKLARIMGALNTLGQGRIVTMAKGIGIEPIQDISMLRMMIADKQATDELEKEEDQNKIRVKEAIIDKEILIQ